MRRVVPSRHREDGQDWRDPRLEARTPLSDARLRTPITIAPLTEVFDIPVANFTWSAEPAGEYIWFVILTERGADVNDPATHLSGDVARVTKN